MAQPLDPTTLRLFLAVVEERSMARAAERERITTPAISKRIADLEAQLDVQLLERSNTGVRPTPAGRSLADDARDILAALEAAQGKLTDYARGVRGEVRVSANPTSMLDTLPQDIQRFAMRYPHVRIFLDERRSAQIVQAVAAGDVDIGLAMLAPSDPELDVAPYRKVRLVLVVPLDHPLSRRRSVRFADAADCDFLLHAESTMMWRLVTTAAADNGFRIKSRVQTTTQEGMRRLVEAGMGVAVMPEQSAAPYAKLHRFRCIPLLDGWAQLQTCIFTRKTAMLPMSVRLLRGVLLGKEEAEVAKESETGPQPRA
ncbi:MAG: LysR family transcriptional regulator [Rhodospirillaceae bacterium]